ncbi:MAG: sugar transferase [Spirochaetaceae bacterium]|nr:sugar transferase [Spirochaetaceae bacterium]
MEERIDVSEHSKTTIPLELERYIELAKQVRRVELDSAEHIAALPDERISNLMNFAFFNGVRRLNKLFEAVNTRLPMGGYYIARGRTTEIIRDEIHSRYPRLVARVLLAWEFVFHRVLSRVKWSRALYFALTKGKKRNISRAEVLGRLISCGFDIVDETDKEGVFHFVVRKVGEPAFDTDPSYGALIRLKRVGMNGKLFGVYKLRTMHPYSEYLQEYVYRRNGLQENGKFGNDFRITETGRIMRKLWLDEFPMFINFFRGELKLVGVRPLSHHYFSIYSQDMQLRRTCYRPGILPPYYYDVPRSQEEIEASERAYFDRYDRHPVLTDLRYFIVILYNILIKRARSS